MQEAIRYRLEDFELYQLARKLRKGVYGLIKQLPSSEKYCLDQQMRRAVVSITNNIAEAMDVGTIKKISNIAEWHAVPLKK